MKSSERRCREAGATHRSVSRLARRSGREELAFLPAALEIVETPPSPIGRAIGGRHHPDVLHRPGLGLVGHDRHRRVGDRKNPAERPHQGRPAVRDRGGALDPGAGRADGQGRRRADRTRSDR